MSWTISLRKPKNKDLLNRYFLSVGKALCIANEFEAKCNHALRVHRVTNASRAGKSFDEVGEISKSFQSQMLGSALRELEKDDDVSEEDVAKLDSARESRNYIAHEGAVIGEICSVRDEYVYERVNTLMPHVRNVAEGDNLVSVWTYEMCEREPAPRLFRQEYVERVIKWVFGDLIAEAEKHKP